MKFSTTVVTRPTEILANDHFVSVPYNCSDLTAINGVIKAGTIIPANDSTAIGVLLNDVHPADNPNGSIVIHGFIKNAKIPTAPAEDAKTALTQITFLA